jgi:hypothetical protein
MKRSVEVLVLLEMVAVIVAMAIAGLCGMARADETASPVVRIDADARLSQRLHGGDATAAVFHVHVSFSTDPPGAQPFTLQQATILFPDHAGTNGRLFPSCSARLIERFHGDVHRCPKGSKIGSGIVKASAIQLGIVATGHVTMFNSRHGKAITFNVQTYLPAYINESFEAPLVQLHGRYGERLTLSDPPELQQILDGVFVAVKDFDVTVGGTVRSHGVTLSYLKARTCPTTALRGLFDFVNGETGQTAATTTDARVRCTTSRAPPRPA